MSQKEGEKSYLHEASTRPALPLGLPIAAPLRNPRQQRIHGGGGTAAGVAGAAMEAPSAGTDEGNATKAVRPGREAPRAATRSGGAGRKAPRSSSEAGRVGREAPRGASEAGGTGRDPPRAGDMGSSAARTEVARTASGVPRAAEIWRHG